MRERFSPLCERLFYALAAVSFFYLTAVALCWNRADPLPIALATAGGLAALAGLWRLSRTAGFAALADDPRRRRRLALALSVLFLVLCLASALTQLEDYTGADWDIWVIHAEAQNIAAAPFPARMQNAEYFYRFPQNAALLALFTGWYRLWYLAGGEGVDFNLAGALLCAGFLWLAQLLFYQAARVFLGEQKALFCLTVWLLVPPLYAYAAIPYSDSMGLPFCTGLLFCLAKVWQKKSLPWAAAAGLLAAAALRMKGTYAVLAVAAVLFLVLLAWNGLKRQLAGLLAFGLCFGVLAAGFPVLFAESGVWGDYSREYEKEEWQVPVTHYLMMAQNPDGPWVLADNEFTFNLQQGKFSFQARTRICLEMCFDRIASRSLAENLLFTNRKVVETWKDGTYQVDQYDRDTWYHPEAGLLQFFRKGTGAYGLFAYLSNGLYFALLLCLAAGAIRRLGQREALAADGAFFAHLCLFGMFLLELVWEWRSRYLFGYLPFLLLAAPCGLEALEAGARALARRLRRTRPA